MKLLSLTPLVVILAIAAATETMQPAPAYGAAKITVVNLDGPGEGFNDPTPAAPVGGNAGVSVGEQRLIAFQYAADLWGAQLDSGVEIRVAARFDPMSCGSTSATLGSASPGIFGRDFCGAPAPGTYYPIALANKLSGSDLCPPGSCGGASDDVYATFNSLIGTSACSAPYNAKHWYYGLDASPAPGDFDLVTVLLHEFGHGLGFVSTVDLGSGQKMYGYDDAFMARLEDHSAGLTYPSMTNAQRVTASTDTGDLHWVGSRVVTAATFLTSGRHPGGHVEMYAPATHEYGSSVSHFSTSLSPDQALEPFYFGANHDVELARQALLDIGWAQLPRCGLSEIPLLNRLFNGSRWTISENITDAGSSGDRYDTEAADDFTVPSGAVWKISRLYVWGGYGKNFGSSAAGPADSINIRFYANAGGVPGALEYEALGVIPYYLGYGYVFDARLPSAVSLGQGTHWVSIQTNQRALSTGAWYWQSASGAASGNPSALRNPGGGWISACAGWGARMATCGIGSPEPDNAFYLSAQTCGDGILDANEQCDDANRIGGDGCSTSCTISSGYVCTGTPSRCNTTCGDGTRAGAEQCDDANLTSGDGCDSNCTVTACGNGVVTSGEQCDTRGASLTCDADCTIAVCGDGTLNLQTGEQCDAGVGNSDTTPDACRTNCRRAACRDGQIDTGEACDDGNANNGDGCDGNCTLTACGNGILTSGEFCDDGNAVSGDGCDSNCTLTACGNGAVSSGEGCDDGNATNGDGCDSNCTATGCRNGIITAGEICDDGNANNGDGCDNNCTTTACGNGIAAGAEACDDGNLVNGDGCDGNCTLTGCRNGIHTPSEQCDDGNATNGDGCDFNCTFTGCGNGIVTAGEQCDAAGASASCDADCTLAACGDATVNPVAGEECDAGGGNNDTQPDACRTTCRHAGCGDGVIDTGEQCDTSGETAGCNANCTPASCGDSVVNAAAGEACDAGGDAADCDADCTVVACGDGVRNAAAGEACDDGGESVACDSDCTPATCGDGLRNAAAGEQCDDADLVDGNGCDSNCTPTGCGNGIVTGGEQCDTAGESAICDSDCTPVQCGDGLKNAAAGEQCDQGAGNSDGTADACRTSCVLPVCGDGTIDTGEQCDDGNLASGDGCDANCTPTHCGNGIPTVEEDCDDGNTVNADGCDANCTVSACGNNVVAGSEECDDGNLTVGDGCDDACAVEDGTWLSNGPEGGHARAVAVNPSDSTIVYAATEVGTFRSTDRGTTWKLMNNGMFAGHSTAVAIDPQDPTRIYVGSAGGGVYKSTDSGASWVQVSSGISGNIETVAIDPTNPDRIYAGGPFGHYRSDDAGASWTDVRSNLPDAWARVLAVDPAGVVYSGTTQGVFRSTDFGASWVGINVGLTALTVNTLAIAPSNPNVLYAGTSGGGAFKTTDAGSSWSQLVGLTDSSPRGIVVDPTDPSVVYVGGYRGVDQSTDGGATWKRINAGLSVNGAEAGSVASIGVWSLAMDPGSASTLYAGTLRGVFRTQDRGRSWVDLNRGIRATSIYDISADPLSPGVIYASGIGGVSKSVDGARSWNPHSGGLNGTFMTSIEADPSTAGMVYATVAQSGYDVYGVFGSADGALNWNILDDDVGSPNRIVVDPYHPGTLFCSAGGLQRSTDGGVNWTRLSNGLSSTSILKIVVVSSSVIVVATDSGVFKSSDSGASWTGINNGITTLSLGALAVDPVDPNRMWAGSSNGGGVFKTVDGGLNWVAANSGIMSGSNERTINYLAVNPANPDLLWLANMFRVYRSTDGGNSWFRYDRGLPFIQVTSLQLDPMDPDIVYAGTYGGGVFVVHARCSNGATDPGEECDDGNLVDGDGCDGNCTLRACGNGIVTAGEACDDGGESALCDSDCTLPSCGDGVANISAGEECDDGNGVNGDGCDVDCSLTACGNGIPTSGEACDDGNAISGDGCDNNCTATACGNGIPTAGEACDTGAATALCDADCTPPACGDGVANSAAGETCDDANAVNGDGCDQNCTSTGCGNGIVTAGEQCDDGNGIDGDACDRNCTSTRCGNGIVTSGEACDTGGQTMFCDADCSLPVCGDGVQNVLVGEACDDGNLINGDGCDVGCILSACGNGILGLGEECDDGNLVDGDGCDSNCTVTGCGNGIHTAGEECDQGGGGGPMVDIGTLGGSNSVVWAVNASGQLVGRSWTGSQHHAYSYSGGVMTDLGTLIGPSRWSEAFGINDSGQIVGSSAAIAPDTNLTTHAFLYSGGVMTDLGTGGAFESIAHDINNNGDVVGYLQGLPGNLAHAFLYSGGVMTDLGSMQGAPSTRVSIAYAINDSGQIVGRAQTAAGNYHAFLYSGGVMADLGTLGGATSQALAINNAGQIVGDALLANGRTRAFLYDGGVMTALGTLGGNNSWATGIDSYGQIVGYSNTAGGNVHAFLYRDGVMHDLGHMGGDISQAFAIGDGGRIAGQAYTTGGQAHGFYYDLCNHDGILDIFEQCDDGDAMDGDGCDASCRIELCHECAGEPSVCSPLADGTSCDDGLFCNGADACDASGACQHAGDPCPGGQCATCDEVNARCFDPFGAACTIGGVCGDAICSGSGSCDLVAKCEGPYGAATCSDSSDNDGDSVVDGLDPDCQPLHEGPQGDPTCTNSIDDDNDGQVDANDRGCEPSPPEVCNGFDDDADGTTDEGFPDFDADDLADCVDQDKDNDGVSNRDDNCPMAANPAQADSDADGSGDACDNNVPAVINTPSSSAITVDGQFEPVAGEWADVTPVSYMGGTALLYTSLDPARDAIYVMIDFSLSTNRLSVGDEVGPISFGLGADGVVDVFVRQGGADSNAAPHSTTSTGGIGDSLRVLVNGNPVDMSSGCVSGAVDFNNTSPNFTTGHNIVELSVRLFGHPQGCYAPAPSFWSVTLPRVVPSAIPRTAGRAVGDSSSVVVSQWYVEVDEGSGDTTIAPIGSDPAPLDAFQCYAASDLKDPKFEPSTVTLTDEFESKSTMVVKPMTVCPPAEYSDPVLDSTANLTCYKIKDVAGQEKFVPQRIQTTNVLGTLQIEATRAAQLCVPTRLDGEASTLGIESFKCYKAKDLKNPRFGGGAAVLTDRFGTNNTGVMRPVAVCNPASTGNAIVNETAHLLCYKLKPVAPFSGAEVLTQNYLDSLRLGLKKTTTLCLPSTVTVLP